MHTLLRSSSLLLLPAWLAAQEPDMAAMMQPAPELKKLAVMVGEFEGTGTARMAANAPPSQWTARSSVRWALDEFAIEEHATITFAGGEIPPLQFHTLIGYDREAKQFRMVAASQMGVISKPGWFVSDKEFVSTHSGVQEGQPYVDHEVVRMSDAGYDFVMVRVAGTGPAFEHVRGSFKRMQDAKPAAVAEASAASPSGEMAKLSRLAGTWKVTGTMVMSPGQDPMPISGTETNTFVFGGHVLRSQVKSDPSPEGNGPIYQMTSFIGWDPTTSSYAQVFVDNMGMIGRTDGRFAGNDQLVFTSSGPMMGAPSAGRAVLEFGSGDAPIKISCHRLQGAHPPMRDFEATYRPAK
jgi:hypothetical protein